MRRLRVIAAAVAFAAGMLVGIGACATPGGSPAPLPGPDGRLDLGSPGAQLATYDGVRFYPACADETLAHEGKVWFSFRPANPEDFPMPTADDASAAVPDTSGVAAASAPGRASTSLGMVIAPGPGDDVGTLTVYEGGFAYWISDSGDVDTWLTHREITYNWVC
ncbi:hypothetical protein [Demequina sp.]|uniref:hypothetical protein n=1 Tax=Demequina sp. TaxID=2050685 RepID=UPI0025C1D6FE|nr:hypothetical protein [Demequina sp.]